MWVVLGCGTVCRAPVHVRRHGCAATTSLAAVPNTSQHCQGVACTVLYNILNLLPVIAHRWTVPLADHLIANGTLHAADQHLTVVAVELDASWKGHPAKRGVVQGQCTENR